MLEQIQHLRPVQNNIFYFLSESGNAGRNWKPRLRTRKNKLRMDLEMNMTKPMEFWDIGKPTMRGIRKCTKCGTFNGTR